MATPSLTIGTVTIKGANYADHPWPQTLGLEAPRVVWHLPVDDATALLAGPQEVTITLTDSTGRKKKIERVYVVGEDHSPDALVRAVILTDVRFYLPFGWVRASYNVTVPSGTGRQTQSDGIAQTTLPIVSNILYVPTSIRGSDDGPVGVAWNAQQIADDILQKACVGHDWKTIVVRNLSRPRASFVPNDVFVDSDGQAALGQALGAIGGLDIRVADDGAIELVDAYLGAERKTVERVIREAFGPSPLGSLERKGKLRFVSMANVASRSARVLFTRRCEIRAESLEVEPKNRYLSVCDNTVWNKTNDFVLINVAPVTDLSLPVPSTVPANLGGGTVAVKDTLLPMDALIDSIAALNDAPSGAPPLSRQGILAGQGGTISSSGILSGRNALQYVVADASMQAGAGPNINWIGRLGAIEGAERRLYKLNPVAARACRKGSIRAERAGLLDAATQTRQPATVYFDYVQRPKNRGLAKNDAFGWNMNSVPPTTPNEQSYPTGIKLYADTGAYNDKPFPLTSAIQAPFDVGVRDSTLGVFLFTQAKQDTTKLHHAAENFEGLVWGLPVINGKTNAGAAIALWEQARQLLTHRVSLVFSAVPAGQDNSRALHSYDVTVADALKRLGAPSDAVTPRAPRREMRVREGVTEARIPWDDNQRQNILGCFFETGTGDPSQLTPVNDLQLKDFAVSVFANYLAAVLDHYEGTMQIGYSPDVMPIGSMRSVTHTLHSDGKIYTTLRCDGAAPVTPPENLMLQSSRNILFGGLG